MQKYYAKISTILLLLLVPGYVCAQTHSPYVIDLINPVIEEIPMSRLFSNVELIQLEPSPKLAKRTVFYLSDSYIIAANIFDNVFAFNRVSGKYEKEISKQGVGEDEYLHMPVFLFGFDEENDLFFFDNKQQWKAVSIQSNKTVAKITKPREQFTLPDKESPRQGQAFNNNQDKGWKHGTIFNPWNLGNGKYAGFVNNSTGNIDVTFVIFDQAGNVLRSFRNTRKYEKNSVSNILNPGQFYKYKGQTYLKEYLYNDTVFLLNDEKLVPHILFDTGDKQLPYESLRYELDNNYDNKYHITFVQETNSYIFFNYLLYHQPDEKNILFSGYYEKSSGKTFVCEAKDAQGGFTDDLNGLSSFNPLYITRNEELIGKISSDLLVQHTENDHLSVLGQTILENRNGSGNPVIIIARLRN